MLRSSKASASAPSTRSRSQSVVRTQLRGFKARPVRWVRRGTVSDRRPNKNKKNYPQQIAEAIFLASPASYVKPEHSLHDQLLRVRLQHWDSFRADNPDKNLPAEIPYEIDRVPNMWPSYDKYCRKSEASKGPLTFYRRQWLRYDEPSFVHVTKVQDKNRSNGYGRTTILTGWHTWRGVTHAFPKAVTSRRKDDWRRLDPSLGHMTQDIWDQLKAKSIPEYILPRPPYMQKELEAPWLEKEKTRIEDIIQSTKSRVI